MSNIKIKKMELLEFEKLDLEELYLEACFDGMFPEGFFVTTEFTYDEEEDSENNILATNITLWDFKIFNISNELITFNNRETKKLKELVEFELIKEIKLN